MYVQNPIFRLDLWQNIAAGQKVMETSTREIQIRSSLIAKGSSLIVWKHEENSHKSLCELNLMFCFLLVKSLTITIANTNW